MPVDDHPIHPKTIQRDGAKYGCHNHPSRKGNGYYAPNRRYLPDGRFVLELVRIETEWIDYDVCPAASDHPCCDGCVHKAPAECDHSFDERGFDQFQNPVMRCSKCGANAVMLARYKGREPVSSVTIPVFDGGCKFHE